MGTYVDELLFRQRKLSAGLTEEDTAELSVHFAEGKRPLPSADGAAVQADAVRMETEEPGQVLSRPEAESGAAGQLLLRLTELERGSAGVQVLRQKIQQEKLERVEAAQRERLMERRPENTAGGHTGSYTRHMETGGIASSPTQRSMQEISRFFERDARRYG